MSGPHKFHLRFNQMHKPHTVLYGCDTCVAITDFTCATIKRKKVLRYSHIVNVSAQIAGMAIAHPSRLFQQELVGCGLMQSVQNLLRCQKDILQSKALQLRHSRQGFTLRRTILTDSTTFGRHTMTQVRICKSFCQFWQPSCSGVQHAGSTANTHDIRCQLDKIQD